jgi:asparagine synthase (glutamine-hydrolysing)
VANVLLIVDPNANRRAQFIARTGALLAPLSGLQSERCVSGDFCALWAQAPHMRVSRVADAEGAAVIWGDAIVAEGSTRADANTLSARWGDPHSSAVFDGFHAAALYDRHVGLRVGADLLGLFPVYYWCSGEVILVGSSPELFRHHPDFRMTLSPVGLVGILLTSHVIDGQTLLEGVRRLAAGSLLLWSGGSSPAEVSRYRLPVSRRYFDRPFSEHVDVLDSALERATSRHVPAEQRHTLLLSGGLDSRMLGGYLAHHGTDALALTLGQPRDLEMLAATRVASTLGFPHRTADVHFEHYPSCADRQARWEHLANGFSTIRIWGVPPLLQSMPPRVVAGYVTDAIVGGPLVHYLPSCEDREPSFETAFAFYNRSGLHPTVLGRLLRRDVFGGLIEHTLDRLRALYESYSDLDSQRAWCFELDHRQRFHVGASAWRLSFGAWPVLPAIDHAVLEAVGAMPASTIARRRLQKALVCRRFPALAALPLDRNSFDTRPVQPRFRGMLSGYARQQWARALSRLPPAWRQERRYYYRVYDINNQGWRAVRHRAEACRSRVLELFDRDALDALVPPAEAQVACEDPIMDSSGLKLLLGFLLWSEDHL